MTNGGSEETARRKPDETGGMAGIEKPVKEENDVEIS